MATKSVNYTPEMTAELVNAYKAAPTSETVAAFAAKFGKNVKSVVAKLSREGVYMKKEYVTKAGAKPIPKEDMATFIGDKLGLDEASASSLAKANKHALAAIVNFINAQFVAAFDEANEEAPASE
jgi:hypothetical protein